MPVPLPTFAAVAGSVVTSTSDELRGIATVAIITCVGLGWIIWWLIGRVDDGCPACAHCVERKRSRDESREAADRRAAERLFGIRREDWPDEAGEPSEEGPSSPDEHDEGHEGEGR